MTEFSLDYTFWLNIVFGALAIFLFWMARRNPAKQHHHYEHHGHAHKH